MKKVFHFLFFTMLLLTFSSSLFSATPDIKTLFNKNISEQEINNLMSGEVVIRNIGNYKKISINPVNKAIEETLSTFTELKPSYLAEIIQIRPKEGNENLLRLIADNLIDIESYAGIPYYSVRQKKYYDLYTTVVINNIATTTNTDTINATFGMDPFGTVEMEILTKELSDLYSYSSTNTSVIKYNGISCIKKQNMKSSIVVFQYGNYYILYGIGGVEAPSVFFLRDRIETSFINRIQTFCCFFFKKI